MTACFNPPPNADLKLCTEALDSTSLMNGLDEILKATKSKREYETESNWYLLKAGGNDTFASLYLLSVEELQKLLQKDQVLSNPVLQAFVKDAIKKRSSCHVSPATLCRYFEHLNKHGSEQITLGTVPKEILNACANILGRIGERDLSEDDLTTIDFIKSPSAYGDIKETDKIILGAAKRAARREVSVTKRFHPYFDIIVQTQTKHCPKSSPISQWLGDQVRQFREESKATVSANPNNKILADYVEKGMPFYHDFANDLAGMLRNSKTSHPDALSPQIYRLIVEECKTRDELLKAPIDFDGKRPTIEGFIKDETVLVKGILHSLLKEDNFAEEGIEGRLMDFAQMFKFLRKKCAFLNGDRNWGRDENDKPTFANPLTVYANHAALISNELEAVKKACTEKKESGFSEVNCMAAANATILPYGQMISKVVTAKTLGDLATALKFNANDGTNWHDAAIIQLFLMAYLDRPMGLAFIVKHKVLSVFWDQITIKDPTRNGDRPNNATKGETQNNRTVESQSDAPTGGGKSKKDKKVASSKAICKYLHGIADRQVQKLLLHRQPIHSEQISELVPFGSDRDYLHGFLNACRVALKVDKTPADRPEAESSVFSKLLNAPNYESVQGVYNESLKEASKNPLLKAVAEKTFNQQQLGFSRIDYFNTFMEAIKQIKLGEGEHYDAFLKKQRKGLKWKWPSKKTEKNPKEKPKRS